MKIKNLTLAEGRGFEPRRPREESTHFPGVPVQPLLHPSAITLLYKTSGILSRRAEYPDFTPVFHLPIVLIHY